MRETGIRDLKNNLSRYLRSLKPGQRIAVTEHGLVVAELRSTRGPATVPPLLANRYAQLIAAGTVRVAEKGDPLENWPTSRQVKLPPGTVRALIDEDRGE